MIPITGQDLHSLVYPNPMNDPLSAITVDAFLVALAQLDSPLPDNVQAQLNEMSDTPDADILDAIAEEYPPLNELYQAAREVFQDYDSERISGPLPAKPDEKAEAQVGEEANDVFRAENSVESAKQAAEKSGTLGQLLQLIKRFKT
jgi:hypothetical protein